MRFEQSVVRIEIVRDLRENTGPVDRVDSGETVCRVELPVAEQCLHKILAFY